MTASLHLVFPSALQRLPISLPELRAPRLRVTPCALCFPQKCSPLHGGWALVIFLASSSRNVFRNQMKMKIERYFWTVKKKVTKIIWIVKNIFEANLRMYAYLRDDIFMCLYVYVYGHTHKYQLCNWSRVVYIKGIRRLCFLSFEKEGHVFIFTLGNFTWSVLFQVESIMNLNQFLSCLTYSVGHLDHSRA